MTMMGIFRVATGHLSEETRDWIDNDVKAEVEERPGKDIRGWVTTSARSGIQAYPTEDGWLIRAMDIPHHAKGVPDDLYQVIAFSLEQGAAWIELNAKAERCEALPVYE